MMVSRLLLLLLLSLSLSLLLLLVLTTTPTFVVLVTAYQFPILPSRTSTISSTTTSLQMSQPPQRKPRRSLQKRRRKQRRAGQSVTVSTSSPAVDEEIKPLVASRSKELGVDYWIDEADLQKEREKQSKRPPDPGQISQSKLRSEIVSPYKQNWIGLISVAIIILATIITQFPELLNMPPTIQNPDYI